MTPGLKSKKRWWARILVWTVVIALALELAFMGVVFAAARHAWSNVPAASDCIIVLGARVYPSGEMSPVLRERVLAALACYRAGQAPVLIVCGGRGGDEPRAEADVMRAYLVESGVPEAAILVDDVSTDTGENLMNAKALMDARGMGSCIVVTSDYHLTRALWQARDVGLSASGQPAVGPDSAYKFMEAYFRETVSWVNYWTGGLVDKVLFWR